MATNQKEFIAEQKVFQDRVDKTVDGLVADQKATAEIIDRLQNSPGTFTPADQADVDALQARNKVAIEKLEALDALTPPVAPPVA